MAKEFNMFELLGEQGAAQPPQAKSKAEEKGEGSFPIEYISVDLLDPSEKNFYSTKDIEELADSILDDGLLQNLVVRPKGDGRYRMIAGHRRHLAFLRLVEQGHKQFEYAPCLVQNGIDDIDEELKLIQTNKQTRTPTGWELVKEAERVRVLLELKAQQEKTPGKMRDRMAEKLKTSPAQVARLETISRHLIPEFMEELKAERLALNTAYELAGMPEDQQRVMFEQHQQKDGGLIIPDVKKEKAAAAPKDAPPPAMPQDTPGAVTPPPVQPSSPPPASGGSGKPALPPQHCKLRNGKCDHETTMKRHYQRNGDWGGCAGCCAGCKRATAESNICPYICRTFKAHKQPEGKALRQLISATIQGKDIELVELDGDSASVFLPYDTAEYEVDLEGTTDRERLDSFIAEVNKLLRGMIDHIGDCLLDGEE